MQNSDPLDNVDAVNIEDLERHPGFQLLKKRLGEELERKRLSLEQAQLSETATAFARGYIASIRVALDIPNILKREARK